MEELRWGVLCGKKCYHVVRKELIPIVGRYLLSSYTSGQGNFPKEPNALVYTEASVPASGFTHNEKLSFAIGALLLAISVDKDTGLCWKQFTGCDEAVHPVLHPLSSSACEDCEL